MLVRIVIAPVTVWSLLAIVAEATQLELVGQFTARFDILVLVIEIKGSIGPAIGANTNTTIPKSRIGIFILINRLISGYIKITLRL